MSETATPATDSVDPAVWPTVWTVLVGGIAVLFDTTIVSVALHSLAGDLHTSVATIQWVSTGYLLALGVTIPIAGWAQRVLGSRRLWMLALGLFLLGSVLSSLAWDVDSLIAFRALQGVGGGIIIPLMSTLVMQAAGGQGIGRVMSAISLPTAMGPILGPVIGGLILAHLHWSWLFWVNVPFCVAGIALAARVLPADGAARRQPFDAVGFGLMAPSLVALLWGLSNASKPGAFGRTDVVTPLLIGLALLAGFVAWALRRRSRALIDLLLLRHWPLASASLLLFLSAGTLYGAMLLMPLYFQELRGTSVLDAGLLLIPQGVGTLTSRSLAGRMSDTMGARWLAVAGFGTVGVTTVPFALAGAHTSEVWLMAALLVRGVGLGLVTVPLMALGFRGLQRDQVPDASIITRIAQQVGGSFGTAVLAVVLTSAQSSNASPAALAEGFHHAFWWASAFTAAGLLVSFALPGNPPSGNGDATDEAPASRSPSKASAS